MAKHSLILGALTLVATAASCTEHTSDREALDLASMLGPGGKADMLSSSHVVREVDMNSTLNGKFNPRVRVYGFTVNARVGAVLNVDVTTAAGEDSFDAEPGAELDTVLAVYGPMEANKPGPMLMQVDDDDTGVAAQLPEFEIEEEGEYLVLLSSWNDTGHGDYVIDLTCDGTDFQCRRPVQDLPCAEGTEFIVGGQSVGTTTWDRCNYVLLEETRVEPGAVLTVNPGVTVKGNFLGEAPFGDVRLVVDGTIQAVGTKEHPVMFTALTENGWGGLVLTGNSTLDQVFIERAEIGIEVVGDGNSLSDVNINSGATGLVFRGETEGHRVRDSRIAKVDNGIVMEETVVEIIDTVILGNGSGVGVRGTDTKASFFQRALVAGFGTGIDLESAELEMVDATIANNVRGVHVTGEDSGVNPGYTCPPAPSFTTPPPRTWPPAPNPFRRDPIFRRVDLVGNSQYAVRIDAPELLVIEDSNIRGNGAGVVIASDSLHEDSRIAGNNIFDNGDGLMQLESFHNRGTLDISGNYWAQISDPDLSASWLVDHQVTIPASEADCRLTRTGTPSGCTRINSSRYTCNAYDCRRSGNTWTCNLTQSIQSTPWTGEVVFTGFSPTLLDAGPDKGSLKDPVQQERDEQGV